MKLYWKIIISLVLIGGIFIGGVLAFNKYQNDEYQRQTNIVNKEELSANDNLSGEGSTLTSRIVKAELLFEELDPEQSIPSDFDTRLLASFESEETYIKVISSFYDRQNLPWYLRIPGGFLYEYADILLNGQVQQNDAILMKLFRDENLQNPVYFYTFNISHHFFYGWVPETAYISYDGLNFNVLERSFKYTDYDFYTKNQNDETIKINFKGGTRDSSIYESLETEFNIFKRSNANERNITKNLSKYFSVQKFEGGRWRDKDNNTFMSDIEFLKFMPDEHYSKSPIDYKKIYKAFPVFFEQLIPTYELMYDQNSFEITNFAKFSTWSFGNSTLTNRHLININSIYGNNNSLLLKQKVNSEYFAAMNVEVSKNQFINPNNQTAYGLRFNTVIIAQGIRILNLPYALELPEGQLRYTFEVVQKDANNNTLAVAISEQNIFGPSSTKDFTGANFYIPFAENFNIEANAKTITININGIDTSAFNGMHSVITLTD